MKDEILNLSQEWDKTFPKSDNVNHKKIIRISPGKKISWGLGGRHNFGCRYVYT